MKKKLLVLLIILITLFSSPNVFATQKDSTVKLDNIGFSLKLNSSLYKPDQKIVINAVIKPGKDEIRDIRTTVKIINYKGETLFNRTFYKNKLSEKFVYTVNKTANEFEPGGYKITAKVSSFQKTIRKTELDFGIASTKSKLNLVLIESISTKPLLDANGNICSYTQDTIDKLSAFRPVRGNIYYSVSPLLLNELKNISSGTKELLDGKAITISENDPLPKKAKKIYDQLIKINDLENSFDQTFSIKDISQSPDREIDWQTNLSGSNPLITNSSPSEHLVENLKPRMLFFNTSNFVFVDFSSKRLIGINPEGSDKLSGFSKASLYSFIAFSAEKMAQGQNKIVILANGTPTLSFQKSMMSNFKKIGCIKLTRIPSSLKEYTPVKIRDKKINKTKLYSLIEDFEIMTNPKNYYLKKAVSNYLKYSHKLTDIKAKNILSSNINNSIKKQFKMFTIKPQAVTLTSSNGKVPVGLSSNANYNANLKLVFKSKDFKTPRSMNLVTKPRENVIIIPVTALYSGNNNVKVIAYAGKHVVCKDTVTVNVILPSTVYFYLFIFIAFVIIAVISAFIFREIRHRKIGTRR